jgi:hypothetical protein
VLPVLVRPDADSIRSDLQEYLDGVGIDSRTIGRATSRASR